MLTAPDNTMEERDRGLIRVIDPGSGQVISEIQDEGREAVDRAVALARSSFESGAWRNLSPSRRARILWTVADLVERRVDELIELEARNTGMSRAMARALILLGAELF